MNHPSFPEKSWSSRKGVGVELSLDWGGLSPGQPGSLLSGGPALKTQVAFPPACALQLPRA